MSMLPQLKIGKKKKKGKKILQIPSPRDDHHYCWARFLPRLIFRHGAHVCRWAAGIVPPRTGKWQSHEKCPGWPCLISMVPTLKAEKQTEQPSSCL